MATRNILDVNSNVIGVLELPDGTPESVWDNLLSLYTYVPPTPTPTQIVTDLVQDAVEFGQSLCIQYAAQNVLGGITQAGQTTAVATYLRDTTYYLKTGSLYAAISEINTLIADTSGTKTSLSPFVTNNLLYSYLNQIQTWLGIPLTPNPGS